MRKTHQILLLIMLAVMLAACGGDSSDEESDLPEANVPVAATSGPPPLVATPLVSNGTIKNSLRPPEGWETGQNNLGVLFLYSSPIVRAGASLRTPPAADGIFMLLTRPINPDGTSPAEVLQEEVDFAVEGATFGVPDSLTINGFPAARAELETDDLKGIVLVIERAEFDTYQMLLGYARGDQPYFGAIFMTVAESVEVVSE